MGQQPFNQIWDGPQGANDQPYWKPASDIRQVARVFGRDKQEIDSNARLSASAPLGLELARLALKVDAEDRRDIPERICDKARELLRVAGEGA